MGNSQNILKNAIIRNSRLCRESENYAHYSVFDRERDLKGWNFVENGTLFGVSGGFYFLTANASSPSLSRSDNFGYIDASLYTEIVLRYKYTRNRNDSVADTGKIQFVTESDPTFDDNKSVTFDIISDGNWHTYKINMGPVTSWVGSILNLKIFFTTNGQPGDDILLSFIKVQKPTFIFCTDACYQDTSVTVIGRNFDVELLNSPAQNFSIFNSSTQKVAAVSNDPTGSNNKAFKLANLAGISAGPNALILTEPEVYSGFLSLRFYATGIGGEIKLKSNVNSNQDILYFKIDSDLRLKYKNGPNFSDFDTPSSIFTNGWNDLLVVFNGDSQTIDVTFNGQNIGRNISYLFSGIVKAFEFANTSLTINDFYIDDLIIVAQGDLNKNCPGIGKQGYAEGLEVVFTKIDIVENVNDTIIVNFNSYGDVVVKLEPRVGMEPTELRDALEEKISQLDLGGYPYCEVYFSENKFTIKSGTYGFDSTVVIKRHNNSSLSDDLGFTVGGIEAYTSYSGRPHALDFKFTNTYRAKSIDLLSLKNNINKFNLLHDPSDFTVEAGSRTAAEQGRRNKISGANKTIIDFYHRASEEGNITNAFFHGVLPKTVNSKLTGNQGQISNNLFNTGFTSLSSYGVTSGDLLVIDSPGYDSNGTYLVTVESETGGILRITGNLTLLPGTNLNFSIQSYSKLKHFRPKLDGTLDLINEIRLGERADGIVYTRTADTFSAEINWYVHRGDLFGIYNAESIYMGNDANGNADALYLEEDGDLIGTSIKVGRPNGQGVKGIGLYLSSKDQQTKASYDIVFDSPTIIKNVDIFGKQKDEKRYYNIAAAVGNGFSVSATITGTHKHRLDTGNGIETETHQNIGYNLTALTDGTKYASNGKLVNFEQNSSEASYFYISGDGEFAGYVYDENGNLIDNSLEYPIVPDGNGGFSGDLNLEITDFKSDPFDLRFSWDVPKTIDRFKIYFKEYPNAKSYFLQWLKNPNDVFDGDLPGYERIGLGNSSEFSKVLLNEYLIDTSMSSPSSINNNAFYQHLLPTFNLSPNVLDTGSKNLFFDLLFPYTIVDKYFDSIRTTSLIWKCLYHESTKISEIEVFSSTQSDSSLESAVEFYFSSDGEFFQRIEPEVLEEGNLRFNIGFPVKAARVVIEPETETALDVIKFYPSDELVKYTEYETGRMIDSVDLNVVPGNFSDPERIVITNKTGQIADVELSISSDEVYDNFLLKTSLNTLDSILVPEIGPPGQILLDEDYNLAVTKNVAINAECYGLKNLSVGKRYYLGLTSNSPSDYLTNGPDLTKWLPTTSNFPKAPPNGLEAITTSGWGMRLFNVNYGGPKSNIEHTHTNTSVWNVTGEFNSSIACEYNMANGSANGAGSRIGIIDSNNRKIYLEKRRVRYRGSNPVDRERNWSEYRVVDTTTSGELYYHLNYCLTPNRCGSTFGSVDDSSEYLLNITRVQEENIDLLRFSYVDSINGTGTIQFAENQFVELDLLSLSTPLVGSLKIYIENFWSDASTNTLTTDTITAPFNYIKINRFLFGGDSTYSTSYNFEDNYKIIGISGSINQDNRENTESAPLKLVAVDLERRFSLDILDIWTASSGTLWNKFNVQFSNTETDEPDLVNWGNSDRSDARWLLFTEKAIPYNSSVNIKYLTNLRVYPDITRLAPEQLTNSEWVYLNNILTDGKYDTTSQVLNTDYPVVAVNLPNHFTLNNFRALDSAGREFPSSDQYSTYKGWAGHCFYNLSSSNTDNPINVQWQPWVEYNSTNKEVNDPKWIAFKTKLIDITYPRHIAEVDASTQGYRTDDIGEVKDSVDFTEYANWFKLEYNFDINIALLDESEFSLEGTLYGSSAARENIGGQLSPTIAAFDNSDVEGVYLTNLPMNIWRVFGDVTVTSGIEEVTVSGDSNQYIIDEEVYTTSITYIEKEISGFQFNVGADSKSIPNTIAIEKLIGTDPTLNSSWSSITTETNLATQLPLDVEVGDTEYQFNNGSPYVYKFNPPIITSGIRLSITQTVDQTSDDKTVNISEFQILSKLDEEINPIVEISNDTSSRVGGRRSLKIEYLAGNSQPVNITSAAALRIGPDPLWSLQDFLKFYIKGSDLFNFSESILRFGRDSNRYYEWDLSTISGTILQDQFTEINLRFKDATVINKIPFNYDYDTGESRLTQLDLTTQEFTYLQIQLKPLAVQNNNISIWLDNFDIKRESFGLTGLNNTNTLYLNNSELVYFPMTDFDIRKGFFEAVVTPDWNEDGILDPRNEKVFTIFSALNSLNESFSCYYSERYGLVIVAYSANTQDRRKFYCGKLTGIKQYKPFKLSIAWDSESTSIDSTAGITVRVWLNDQVVKDFIEPWSISNTKDNYFFIGGRANQNDVTVSGTSDYPKYVNDLIITPQTESLTGGIQNLILAKTPQKLYYNDLQLLKDKIYLSIDGINYYNGISPVLPITIYNVDPEESIDVWVKVNIPNNRRNLARTGYLRSKWRLT